MPQVSAADSSCLHVGAATLEWHPPAGRVGDASQELRGGFGACDNAPVVRYQHHEAFAQ
jgi:hypothetical protein